MNKNIIWKKTCKHGPLVTAAIHDGHELRDEISKMMILTEDARLREEDPFTGEWTKIGDTQIIVSRSRFETDVNRPREKAVYQVPDDAWGLNMWSNELSEEMVAKSLSEYDAFYKEMFETYSNLEKEFGHLIIFDLHTYNHKRDGADGPEADPETNPEVNIGTGTMNREKWSSLIDRFIADLRNFNFNGRSLDVRENIKFKGGNFSRWTHDTFPKSACSISIEFKKFFMDEWTGKPDVQQLGKIQQALESTIPGVLEELEKINNK